MILFVIFGTVLATQCLGLVCAILALFDHEHRLHADRLSQRKGPRVDLVTGCCQVRSSYHLMRASPFLLSLGLFVSRFHSCVSALLLVRGFQSLSS